MRFKEFITQSVHSQEKGNEQIFHGFLENSMVGQVVVFASGSMLANQAFCHMVGYTEEELATKHWRELNHPEDLPSSQLDVDQMLRGEKPSARTVKRYLRKDGSCFWAELYTTVYHEPAEWAPYFLSTIIDISLRVQYETELETMKKMLVTFLDASEDKIILKDENFRYLVVNQAVAKEYGKEKNEIQGRSDFDFLDNVISGQFRSADKEALRENKIIRSEERIGEKIYETRKFPVPLHEERVGVGTFVRDITEDVNQRELLRKMSETNRIVTECMIKPFQSAEEQMEYALHEAQHLTESEYGYIYLYDEEKQEFTPKIWTNTVDDDCAMTKPRGAYPLHTAGLGGEVIRTRRPIVIQDYQNSEIQTKGLPFGHLTIQSYLSIPLFENDKIVAVIGFANKKTPYTEHDVTAISVLMNGVWIAIKKKEKEKETELLLERNQAMIENHDAVMLLLEPESGRIVSANPAAMQFYGYSKEELLKLNMTDINTLGKDIAEDLRHRALLRRQRRFTSPHRLKSGEVRMVDVYSCPIPYNGKTMLYSIIFDVTQREEATKQIHYLAYHDYLTEIYNRRFFDESFHSMARTGEFYPLGVIMGDMNGLKLYNDTFGHAKGDKAIIALVERMKQSMPADAQLARIGGDEFAMILPRTNEQEIRAYLDLLEQRLDSLNIPTEGTDVSISFGYGLQRKPEDGLDSLLKEAEAFMYNRKYYSNRSSRSSAVHVIMETLFTKSEREKYHSERVSQISEAIAKSMKLDKEMVNKIRVAGLLHDIGKIGIEESILNKPGKLDTKEWEIMKLHCAKGAKILGNTLEFHDIADWVLAHHERYDGNGYPNKRLGEKIPIAARIIAVADSYDAMTHERPYQKAMTSEEAIVELQNCAGGQLDPAVVQLFLEQVLVLHPLKFL
jgi:diguanylate cyclase (GGDEF)-like protein/PAS domain S-box-containing protein/putative nucleotidyltransferase with HDIG domain